MDTLLIVATALLAALLIAALVASFLRAGARRQSDASAVILHQRLEALAQQVNAQLEQSRQASERSSRSVSSQVQSFTKGMTELQEEVRRVQTSVKEVASFQDLFSSAKRRGSWGELSLGAILKEYFPRGGFEEQYRFSSGEIVDAALKLPNDLLLPIDSKFSWENFQKMKEARDDAPRAAYRKQFLSDVRKRVDEIATKYILPGEGTVDMALMYMPAESIYYEVIQDLKDDDVAEYARRRKVYLVSPNTLYITLSSVIHWFKDMQLQRQTRDIMKRLENVIRDAATLENDFRKLGDHLSNANSAYERSGKKLDLLVERTQKVIDLGEQEETKKLA